MLCDDLARVQRFVTLDQIPKLVDRAGRAAALYCWIAERAGDDGGFELMRSDPAKYFGWSVSTVTRQLDALVLKGLIAPNERERSYDPFVSRIVRRYASGPAIGSQTQSSETAAA